MCSSDLLLDDTGPRTRLRYVFDIADTHLVRGGKTPLLWNLDSHEHEQTILDHLADTYGLSQTDSMNAALMELAQQLTCLLYTSTEGTAGAAYRHGTGNLRQWFAACVQPSDECGTG